MKRALKKDALNKIWRFQENICEFFANVGISEKFGKKSEFFPSKKKIFESISRFRHPLVSEFFHTRSRNFEGFCKFLGFQKCIGSEKIFKNFCINSQDFVTFLDISTKIFLYKLQKFWKISKIKYYEEIF